MRVIKRCLLAAALAACACAAPMISTSTTTITGISAGGAMAVQYGVAKSSSIHAVGVIAGLPYYCAQGELYNAEMCMESPMLINVNNLNFDMNISATEGFIDPVSNIGNQSVMLFSGLFDTVVNHGSMELLQAQYKQLGVSELITYFNYTAEHAWITNFYGSACSTLGSPYINNCDLDFAGEFFKMAWRKLGLQLRPRGTFNVSNMKSFNQGTFGADALLNSMDSIGYYYIPKQCQKGGNAVCHIHVNFHGCTQEESVLGQTYVDNTGLNEWAETNNIIVIYPQAAANMLLENPNACFDWWGYTGAHYADNQGTQVVMVDSMVKYLVQHGELPSSA